MIPEIGELLAVLEKAADAVADIVYDDEFRRRRFAAEILVLERKATRKKRRRYDPPPSLAELIEREVDRVFAQRWVQHAPPGRAYDGQYLTGVKMRPGKEQEAEGLGLQVRSTPEEYDDAVDAAWKSAAQRPKPKSVKPTKPARKSSKGGNRKKKQVTLATVAFLERPVPDWIEDEAA